VADRQWGEFDGDFLKRNYSGFSNSSKQGARRVQPFNTHEKRLFVQMYVAAQMGGNCWTDGSIFRDAVKYAEEAWQNALEDGLIQDHDAEPVSEVKE